MAEEKTILLTQEAYDKMKEELAWREGEYRDEILSKVSAARAEGDLSENGGYQAAREAQRVNQGRIDELTVKLRNAKILTAPGMWMQNFTTNEPDDSMIECAIRSLELVLP